jgi:opacity protein-like surface antigen
MSGPKPTLNRASRLTLAAALAGAFLFAPRPSRAAEWRPFSIEMNAGAVTVTEKGFGHGLRYGGGVLWRASRKFGLEVLLEKYNVPVDGGTDGILDGQMRTNALLFNGYFFFAGRGPLRPYAIAGIGFYFIGYSPNGVIDGPIDLDIVDRMALQLGGGLDLRISSRLAVTGKVRCNMVKTWVETLPRTDPIRDTDPIQQNILHLYALTASLGLKLSF